MSSTAEDAAFCSVGGVLRLLSPLHEKNVDGQVCAQPPGSLTLPQHGERERRCGGSGGNTRGNLIVYSSINKQSKRPESSDVSIWLYL